LTVSQILEAFADVRTAIMTKDARLLEELHDPEFKATELHGQLMTAEEHIAAIVHGEDLELEFSDLAVMKLGDDLALAWGRQTLKGYMRPEDLTAAISAEITRGIEFALTVVWRRSGGRWRLLTFHVSIVQT
jgi:Domain of unknown function (DUF4440)